uniref:Opsin n=1 Tax=Cladonema radiatum TaxID=264074 RepID=A9CR39_9CNID|nr:opsin [Cladonema radiatum]
MAEVTAPIVGLFLIAGIFLNVLVVIGMLKKQSLVVKDFLVVSFACCSLVEICFGFIWEAYGRYIDDSSLTLCKMAGFGTTFPAFTSIIHLVAMAFERYISILHPMTAHKYFVSSKVAFYFIAPSWLFGFVWAFLPIFGWGGYIREKLHTYRCSVIATDNSAVAQSYNYSLLVLYYFLPSSLIIFCCVCVQLEIQKMTRRISNGLSSAMKERTKKTERNHFILVCIVIISYFLSWTPYAISACWFTFFNTAPDELVSYSALFAKSCMITNPLVYAFFYKEFRETLKNKVFSRNIRVQTVEAPTSSLQDTKETNH